jgi:hypothetical protein
MSSFRLLDPLPRRPGPLHRLWRAISPRNAHLPTTALLLRPEPNPSLHSPRIERRGAVRSYAEDGAARCRIEEREVVNVSRSLRCLRHCSSWLMGGQYTRQER